MRIGAPLLGAALLVSLPVSAELGLLRPTWMAALDRGGDEGARAVAYDPLSATFLAAGNFEEDGERDGLLAAYHASDGRLAWSSRVDFGGGAERFTSLAVAGGRIFAGGHVEVPGGPTRSLVVAQGGADPAWVQPAAESVAPNEERVVALAATVDGATVLALQQVGTPPATDLALVAYDGRTGEPRWRAQYDGPAGGEDVPVSLALSPAGDRAFVGGRSWGGEGPEQDALVLAYGVADGALLWEQRVDGLVHGMDGVNAVAVAPDGTRVYAAGITAYRIDAYDLLALAFDADTGARTWAARYSERLGSDMAHAVAVTPDGSTVVATGERWYGARDVLTVAFDAVTGAFGWSSIYAGPAESHDAGYAVAAGDHEVLVGGTSGGFSTSFDLLALAYDTATGQQRWAGRHDHHGGFDFGVALAADPQGRAVVAGEGPGSGGSQDLVLAAFETPPSREPLRLS